MRLVYPFPSAVAVSFSSNRCAVPPMSPPKAVRRYALHLGDAQNINLLQNQSKGRDLKALSSFREILIV